MNKLLSTTIGQLRAVAFMEGISLLLILFVSMPLKYLLDIHEPNLVVGLMHGVLFLAYVALAIWSAIKYKWSFLTTILALAASIIPFGTFVADDKIFLKQEEI